MAGCRVLGGLRVPLGRPGPALAGSGGLAGVPMMTASRRNPLRTQIEVSDHSDFVVESHYDVDVYQHGLVVAYDCGVEPPVQFSTDLTDWWPIPGVEFLACRDV